MLKETENELLLYVARKRITFEPFINIFSYVTSCYSAGNKEHEEREV